jgi:hypothetical protein
VLCQLGTREHPHDPGCGGRLGGVEAGDRRGGDVAAHEGDVQRARGDAVGEEGGGAVEQRRGVGAVDALADQIRGCAHAPEESQ